MYHRWHGCSSYETSPSEQKQNTKLTVNKDLNLVGVQRHLYRVNVWMLISTI